MRKPALHPQLPAPSALFRMSALRQALLLASAFVVMTIAAGFIAIAIVSDALTDDIDEQLRVTAQNLVPQIHTGLDAVPGSSLDDDSIGFLTNEDVIQGPMSRDAFDELGYRTAFGDEIGLDDDDWRLLVVSTETGRLAVAVELETISDTISVVTSALGTVLALTVIACLATGLTIGIRAQRRLGRMTATLDSFAAGNLDARIDAKHRRGGRADDLDHAATRIDDTLDRLQSLVEQMRNLSASMAHELKTPLARLRVSIETLAVEVTDTHTQEILAKVLQETDTVIGIFDALLRIAQLDAGARRDRFVTVDLTGLATDMTALYLPVIEGSGRTLHSAIDSAATVRGDRELIGQLIANLLENAIAHTPSGTTIGVQVSSSRLVVWDNGDGIPPADRERILQPFFRTEGAGYGTGLGLATVRAIAELHGASIAIGNNNDTVSSRRGYKIEIQFPSA